VITGNKTEGVGYEWKEEAKFKLFYQHSWTKGN